MLNLKHLFWNTESEPYSKVFNRNSSLKRTIEGSVRHRSSWNFVFHWEKTGNARKNVFNCFDFSTIVTHGTYTIFEIVREFMLKSLNFCCNHLLSNFTPIWSYIENGDLCFDLKSCINIDLNCLIDLAPIDWDWVWYFTQLF